MSGHLGPRSEMLRHFGPHFLGPKCLRSEVSGHLLTSDRDAELARIASWHCL